MTNNQCIQVLSARNVDKPGERAVSAAQIMEMRTTRYVWHCPGCEHELPFGADQAEAIPFFIVRHLLTTHNIEPERIIQAEPALTEEVRSYCRQMRLPR